MISFPEAWEDSRMTARLIHTHKPHSHAEQRPFVQSTETRKPRLLALYLLQLDL